MGRRWAPWLLALAGCGSGGDATCSLVGQWHSTSQNHASAELTFTADGGVQVVGGPAVIDGTYRYADGKLDLLYTAASEGDFCEGIHGVYRVRFQGCDAFSLAKESDACPSREANADLANLTRR